MASQLNFMLTGKTGEGMSATGNSLLNRTAFTTSFSASPETKEVIFSFAMFDNCTLVVVDEPGLNPGLSQVENMEAAAKHVEKALPMCYGGIDAFLFVIKFVSKFTAEDKRTLENLKKVFGPSYLNHVIVIVTYGDLYYQAKDEKQLDICFTDWCSKQTGEFRELYDDCKGRFVLFNNREKDEEKKRAQIQEIVKLAQDLREQHGRYTSQCFQDAEKEREQLILETKVLETKAPQMNKKMLQQTRLFSVDEDHSTEVKLNFLLMGKTGQGKSATGNSLLRRQAFKASASVTSVTKDVDFHFAKFGIYTFLVVDGPGLADTEINTVKSANEDQRAAEESMKKAEEMADAATKMDTALAMCYGGVDAFLFVIKFGSRFTSEDKFALDALKHIFGDKYLDHVIVVVTGGDSFQGAMEEQECKSDFHEWCSTQSAAFRDLYENCKQRFVLFNNREKDDEKKRAQIQEIVRLANGLRDEHGRYTSESFQNAEQEREKLILKYKAPHLALGIQEKISLLTAEIQNCSQKLSNKETRAIRDSIHGLISEIKVQDKGYNVLKDLLKRVEDLEGSLDDVVKLQRLAKKLEDDRKETSIWANIGSVVGGAISFVVDPVVATANAVGAAAVATVNAVGDAAIATVNAVGDAAKATAKAVDDTMTVAANLQNSLFGVQTGLIKAIVSEK